jgi:hypothetical protein
MSTDYTVLRHDGAVILLHEHSSMFDLEVDITRRPDIDIQDISPYDIATMAIKMLKAVQCNDLEALYKAVDESRREHIMGIRL